MRYRWRKNHLRWLIIKASLENKFNTVEDLKEMLNNYDLTKKEYIDFTYNPSNLQLNNIACKHANYISMSEDIELSVKEELATLFLKINEYNVNKEILLPKMDMSNEELITYTHDIISSLKLDGFTKLYDYLLKNHHLNIQYTRDYACNSCIKYYGETYHLSNNKFSYINFFRNNDITDIESLVHELFHAYLNSYLYTTYDNDLELLTEIDGKYGSLYAIDYMKKDKIPDIERLEYSFYLDNVFFSYLIYINDLLYKYSNNTKYNVKEVNKHINNIIPNNKLKLDKENFSSNTQVSKYKCICELLSYLVVLELRDIYEDPFLILREIRDIKLDDNVNITSVLNKYNINMFKNNYKSLRKINNEMNKNIIT